MNSAASDHESSSDASYLKYSPQSSPSQQVPQLTSELTQLSCAANNGKTIKLGTGPYLKIIEQPQSHFRFRYGSEMTGTHGCLAGMTVGPNKTKTHPTVQLVNYQGQALIRCHLAQWNNPEEHPHKLVDDDQEIDVSKQVPENGSYIVAFRGIGIIHTAKRDVSALLLQRLMKRNGNVNGDVRDTQAQCDLKAKHINLNIVRLKFTAHDLVTGAEICEPVFSECIYNLKSSATNDLKICRISRSTGSPSGGEDVFMLVEKVNKKHTMIRFFELDDNGDRVWTAVGQFNQTDVHHQYAIVFRTPPYKEPKTAVDVTVYIELVRTSDGRTSEPKEFQYKADPVYKQMMKRKHYLSREAQYQTVKKSRTEVNHSGDIFEQDIPSVSSTISMYTTTPATTLAEASPSQYEASPSPQANMSLDGSQALIVDPMWSGVGLPATEPSVGSYQLNTGWLATANVTQQPVATTEPRPMPDDMMEFLSVFCKNYDVDLMDSKALDNIDFDSAFNMVPDSPGPATCGGKYPDSGIQPQGPIEVASVQSDPNEGNRMDYNAFYKAEDGAEVKKLVTDVCTMIKNNKYLKKQEIRNRLERLFDIRLSNGDTLLHMTLFSSPSTLEYIVKVIDNVKATALLDCANERHQTALHLAVLHDMSNIVTLLVAKGANPMMKDVDDLNAVHYAVKYNSCLEPLLDAIKENEVPCDLNDCNSEKQSPLHLAVIEGSAYSARLLLQHGASARVRDAHGRTPLHLAAYDDRLAVTETLLEFIPLAEVDTTDDSGNTALQIVCGSTVREHTVDIVRLLLEKKANPLKSSDCAECAWRAARSKPALRALLARCAAPHCTDTDDEYESADEFDSGEDISVSSLSVALEEVR